jgi:hypothetical protein
MPHYLCLNCIRRDQNSTYKTGLIILSFILQVLYNNNSISIPRSLKSFMLKNCKVDFLGNSEVAFFYTPCRHAMAVQLFKRMISTFKRRTKFSIIIMYIFNWLEYKKVISFSALVVFGCQTH